MNTSISKNIKRLRQQAGLTQEQMAEKLFVTRQTVSLWENGKTQPDIQTLERIAECFGVELMTVLYGNSLPKSEEEQRKEALIRTGAVTIAVFLVLTVFMQLCQHYRHSEVDFISRSSYLFRSLIGIYIFPVAMLLCGFKLANLLNIQEKKRFLYKIMAGFSAVSMVIVWLAHIIRAMVDSRNISLIAQFFLDQLSAVYDAPWIFCIWGICLGVGRTIIHENSAVNIKKARSKKDEKNDSM